MKYLICSDARERIKMVKHRHTEITFSRQYELLGLHRFTQFDQPVPVRDFTLRIMPRIDALYLKDHTEESPLMVYSLAGGAIPISRESIRNFM